MREKIALYCDINQIENPALYQDFFDALQWKKYQHCIAYNTVDFLVLWIWDHTAGAIDDEKFFLIWDIDSERPIKQPRPHLDAVQHILSDIHDNTMYVVDFIAKSFYTHQWHDWQELVDTLHTHNSDIYVI